MAVKSRSSVRNRQPAGPVPISAYWLARGLSFFNAGNGYYWQRGKGWMGTGTIAGTPKNATGKLGVSKGFGATLGTGTTDRIDAGFVPIQQAPYRSIVAHIFLNGGGGGGLGRIFQDVSGTGLTGGDESLYLNTGGAAISYVRRATTNGQYVASSQPTGRWSSFGVSHDQTTVGVAPKLYIDAIESDVTVNINSNGSFTATGTTLSWGNRASDGARNWDGLIGPVAFFDCLLTEAEHKALNDNIWQVLAPRRRKVPVASGSSTSLVIQDATHAHTADNLVLTSSTALTIADALHAHASDNLVLTSATALTIADAAHAHAADNLTLTTTGSTSLTVDDATHAHTADNLVLTSAHALTIADATHAHAAENLTLAPSGSTSLTVADATHAHAADSLVLTSEHALVIADATHAHAADNLTLTASGAPTLSIEDALHAHSADSIVLTSQLALAIADATHAHYADNLTLYLPGTAQPAGARVGPRMAVTGSRPANVQTSARAARR